MVSDSFYALKTVVAKIFIVGRSGGPWSWPYRFGATADRGTYILCLTPCFIFQRLGDPGQNNNGGNAAFSTGIPVTTDVHNGLRVYLVW